jgi:hypothetical protein
MLLIARLGMSEDVEGHACGLGHISVDGPRQLSMNVGMIGHSTLL